MKKQEEKEVRFLAVWPCLLNIDTIVLKEKSGSDKWDTTIEFFSKKSIKIPFGEKFMECSNSAFIEIKSKMLFQGTDEELFTTFALNPQNCDKIITKHLKLINDFIIRIKYSYKDSNNLRELRNIGILDLTLHNLIIDEKGVYMRTNSLNLITAESESVKNIVIQKDVPREWALLTRAADLINIGFYDEGLIVSFALLDYEVQSFIKKSVNYLIEEEIKSIITGIQGKRLEIYLGPLLKLLKIESPLDDETLKTDLKWLNKKRNDIMHNGEYCTATEANRALNIVISILEFLNKVGNDLVLPHPAKLIW